jgi:hypothetical protein
LNAKLNASAEHGDVDVFVSTDDKLVKAENTLNLKMKVINPLNWLMEVL